MTLGRQVPLRGSTLESEALLDDNDDQEELSPSDGYFGHSNTVPAAVFVPDPSLPNHPRGESKAQEAAREANLSGFSSPQGTRYTPYTPATTHAPATSSRRDSGSAYTGMGRRYLDSENGEAHPTTLIDEPPPLYADAVAETAQPSISPSTAAQPPVNASELESAPPRPRSPRGRTWNVGEPLSSFRTAAFGGGAARPQSMADADADADATSLTHSPELLVIDEHPGSEYDEESSPVLPRWERGRRVQSRGREGCCGKRKQPKENGCCGNRKQPKENGCCGNRKSQKDRHCIGRHNHNPHRKFKLFMFFVGIFFLLLIIRPIQWKRTSARVTIPASSNTILHFAQLHPTDTILFRDHRRTPISPAEGIIPAANPQ